MVDDAELLVNALAIATANSNAEDTALRVLCYSPSMLLCALTEKLLRITYLHIISDIEYVPISKATLGELLNEDNQKMVDLFGKDHIKNLAFFFLQVGEKKIGHNFRNSLAHWSDISQKNLTLPFVAELLWLFTDVLNTVLWYIIEPTIPDEGTPSSPS